MAQFDNKGDKKNPKNPKCKCLSCIKLHGLELAADPSFFHAGPFFFKKCQSAGAPSPKLPTDVTDPEGRTQVQNREADIL